MPKRSDKITTAAYAYLRERGYFVFDTHAVGHGFPDCVIANLKICRGLELKSYRMGEPGARLTLDEALFHAFFPFPEWLDIIYGLEDLKERY